MTAEVERPRYGGPAHGKYKPFQPGHELSTKHGAYSSPLKLANEAAEIAEQLRPTLAVYSPADEVTLDLLAVALVRIRRASAALDAADGSKDEGKLTRLSTDLRAWIGTARNLANDLGMTPTSRARLGLDLARTEDALDALMAKGREARARAGRHGQEVTPS